MLFRSKVTPNKAHDGSQITEREREKKLRQRRIEERREKKKGMKPEGKKEITTSHCICV